MKEMNINIKVKHFLALAITITLSMTLIACDQSNQVDQTQGNIFVNEELEQNNLIEDVNLKNNQTEQGTSGPEPNPESQFGQLNLTEQEEMLSWLDTVQKAYSEIASSIDKFASLAGQLRSQVPGESLLLDLAEFQELKSDIETELDRVETASGANLSDAWYQVRKPFEATNQLYRSYLEKLAQINVHSDDFVSQIEAALDELSSSMQEALDSLVDFKS